MALQIYRTRCIVIVSKVLGGVAEYSIPAAMARFLGWQARETQRLAYGPVWSPKERHPQALARNRAAAGCINCAVQRLVRQT